MLAGVTVQNKLDVDLSGLLFGVDTTTINKVRMAYLAKTFGGCQADIRMLRSVTP